MATNNRLPEVLHPSEDPAGFFINAAQDHIEHSSSDSSGFPMPTDVDGEVEWPANGNTALRFVFWAHTGENASKLTPAVEGSDVIALEEFGAIDHTRRDLSDMKIRKNVFRAAINYSLDAELSPSERNILASINAGKNGIDKNSVAEALEDELPYGPTLKALAGSGTRAEWLDVDVKHSAKIHRLDTEELQNRREFRKLLADGSSFDALTDSMLKLMTAKGAVDGFREIIARKQIERLVKNHPGANITVVYGAGHLALTRMIDLPELTMQRIFLPDEDERRNLSGRSVWYNQRAIIDMVKAGLTPQEFSVQQAVLDKMAEISLISQRVLAKYYKLDPEQKAKLLEEMKDLWEKEIPQDSSRFKRNVRKRQKATRKALIKAI